MTSIPTEDRSNGYEAVSGDFMSIRSKSIGVATVRNWAGSLPPSGSVLDMGCGHGTPISRALIDEGLTVYGIDASPSLIAAFRSRFPGAPVECGAIEDSQFFGRRFDGVIAWGLMFLLAPDVQATLFHKVASALRPGGRFLFTAPHQACEWLDNLTGQKSVSLGSETYRGILESEGLALVGETEDEGRNHYYFVCRPGGAGSATSQAVRPSCFIFVSPCMPRARVVNGFVEPSRQQPLPFLWARCSSRLFSPALYALLLHLLRLAWSCRTAMSSMRSKASFNLVGAAAQLQRQARETATFFTHGASEAT